MDGEKKVIVVDTAVALFPRNFQLKKKNILFYLFFSLKTLLFV